MPDGFFQMGRDPGLLREDLAHEPEEELEQAVERHRREEQVHKRPSLWSRLFRRKR